MPHGRPLGDPEYAASFGTHEGAPLEGLRRRYSRIWAHNEARTANSVDAHLVGGGSLSKAVTLVDAKALTKPWVSTNTLWIGLLVLIAWTATVALLLYTDLPGRDADA